jgi:preprotein translocase subunit SecA
MRIFNGERIKSIMTRLNVPEDEPITAGMVSRAIEGAQKKVEGHNFDIRKNLIEYDDVMNKQRTSIYNLRRQVLSGDNIERLVLDMMGDITSQLLDTYVDEKLKSNQWDLQGLESALVKQFGVSLDLSNIEKDSNVITQAVSETVKKAFDKQKIKLGEHFENVQRIVLLQTIDTKWKEHLSIVDRLKEGINLRAFAQKDPLIEYKKEAFYAFENMNTAIKSEALEVMFKVQINEQTDMQGFDELNEYDSSELDFQKNEVSSFESNPSHSYSDASESNYSLGQGYSEEPKLNRAERRRREKSGKRKK